MALPHIASSLALASTLLLAAPAVATAAAAEGRVEGAARSAEAERLVERAIELLRARYVDPDKVDGAAAGLRAALADGHFSGLTGQVLAARLTGILFAATSDKHVYVQHEPERYASLLSSDRDDAERDAFVAEWARATNHGLVEMKVLAGNVRYLKIAPLHWIEGESEAAYARAMDFLRGGDALVIDLAETPGGSPAAVNHLASHFLPVGTHLMTFEMGPAGRQESRVEAGPAGGLIAGKPVYVLTSGKTGSAAEEAAMHFKHFGIARLVGETTAGAGHRNDILPLADGYTISISVGRAIHSVTGDGWEGAGVVPDVTVSPQSALAAAHRSALIELREKHSARAEAYGRALSKLGG